MTVTTLKAIYAILLKTLLNFLFYLKRHEIHELTIGQHVEHLRGLPDSSFYPLNDVHQLDKNRKLLNLLKA
jgi:hypothetical protein